MRSSLRSKLMAIVGVATSAFVILIVASALIARRSDQELARVENRLLPKVELGPRLEGEFERLRRGMQDAVAAYDLDALAKTRELRDRLQEDLAAGRAALDAAQADPLARAIDDYYSTALDVSRRLLVGETGEALVGAMTDMQARQTRTANLLRTTTSVDRRELSHAFAAAARAQSIAAKVRLVISGVCLAFVLALSLWLSRGVLRSVAALTQGLGRFGRGDFLAPIVGLDSDELGEVATQANKMASSLRQLATERDRMDWMKNGQAGLSERLRGDLELPDVAARSVGFLASYLEAPVGALYELQADRRLRVLGKHGLSGAEGDEGSAAAPSFALGEGVVGQAALQRDITLVKEPPPGYLQVRSGLGEAAPRVIALIPLLRAHASSGGPDPGRDQHTETVSGVIELAFFAPWSEAAHELLLSVRETIAIAIEVARARAAMRSLLAETQRQAQLLANQEEDLRARNEELQSQQEELRQSNEELTSQARELEAQRAVLEERNNQLDEARTELEQKAAELTTASAYKSQFLANMSHELRTPLNSMLLLSNLLAVNESRTLTDKQVEYAQTIYSAGRDLLALINQVLDLARIEAGKYDIQVAPVPLGELVDSLQRVFLPLASDRGLALSTRIGADLPATITSDRRRIEQILNNLLANAIKFTEKGEVTLVIGRPGADVIFQREDLRPEHTVAFEVSDTGLGISPRDHERIFAPFEQVDAAPDRRYGGTGLGLNIARELVHLLGGELQVRSSLGAGSTFVCYLPEEYSAEAAAAGRAPPAVLDVPLPLPPSPSPSTSSQLPLSPVPKITRDAASHGTRSPENAGTTRGPPSDMLLIIEDDRHFAEALGDIIARQGMQFRIAHDGRTGLRMAHDAERPPAAIILDVMLPDIDGWTVMARLRADPVTASVPVHFISAVDGAEHGADLGAIGYLKKPATPEELIRMVQSLAIDNHRRKGRVLVVENLGAPDSLVAKLQGENFDLRRAGSAAEAMDMLARERYACMILDLSLADMDGLEFLRVLRARGGSDTPSVVVYTARPLSKAEAQVLEAHAEAVVLNEGSSTERLLDEVRLFVRRLNEGLTAQRQPPPRLYPADLRLKGRKILVADDDMRTLYAVSAMLRAKGVEVVAADTGQIAVASLNEHPDVDAVLMDIMMPEMDGYEAMRRIRQDPRFASVPIIALTAKAMKGDEEKCRAAGASDYLAKPVDPDQLVAVLHAALLSRVGAEERA